MTQRYQAEDIGTAARAKRDAYDAGVAAQRAGWRVADCPHRRDPQKSEWLRGFMEAATGKVR